MTAGLARAACVCADAGNIDGAVEIVPGIEQPAYEASRLLDATSLLNRLPRNDEIRASEQYTFWNIEAHEARICHFMGYLFGGSSDERSDESR